MLIFLNLHLLLFVEFDSTGLPTKSTPTFFTPLANGRGLPKGMGEGMRFDMVLREGSFVSCWCVSSLSIIFV